MLVLLIRGLSVQDPIAAYYIRFVGQEHSERGGHLGAWAGEIWSTEILEMRPIPAPKCEEY